jgi:hypothetical protein
MPSLEGNSRKKAILAILAASNKKNELEKQDKVLNGLSDKVVAPKIDKMLPRTNMRMNQLPVYMQVRQTIFMINYLNRITTAGWP